MKRLLTFEQIVTAILAKGSIASEEFEGAKLVLDAIRAVDTSEGSGDDVQKSLHVGAALGKVAALLKEIPSEAFKARDGMSAERGALLARELEYRRMKLPLPGLKATKEEKAYSHKTEKDRQGRSLDRLVGASAGRGGRWLCQAQHPNLTISTTTTVTHKL